MLDGLAGQQILIVHGSRDRVASPAHAAALATRFGRQAHVRYVSGDGGKHAMLSHHRLFDGLAAQFASVTLLGTDGVRPLAGIEPGEGWIRL